MSADMPPLRLAAASERLRGKPGRPRKPALAGQVADALPPRRLLDLEGAATYLAVSPWTIRDLISSGTLARVRVPLPQGGELRRILLDVQDLDRLIGAWKERQP